jgi:hypothetical protein
LCGSVLMSAVVVWLSSGCLPGEGSGAVFVGSWHWSLVREGERSEWSAVVRQFLEGVSLLCYRLQHQ